MGKPTGSPELPRTRITFETRLHHLCACGCWMKRIGEGCRRETHYARRASSATSRQSGRGSECETTVPQARCPPT